MRTKYFFAALLALSLSVRVFAQSPSYRQNASFFVKVGRMGFNAQEGIDSASCRGVYQNDNSAFPKLKDVVIPEEIEIEGFTYTIKRIRSGSVWYPEMTTVTIPGCVTRIDEGVFSWANLTKVIFLPGDEELEVETEAFCWLDSLTSFTVPERWRNIVSGTFLSCTKLAKITLPKQLKTLGEMAFFRCAALKDVYCHAEVVPEIIPWTKPNYVDFEKWFNMFPHWLPQETTLHVPACAVEEYKKTDFWNQFGNIVPLTDEEISDYESGL